MGEARRPISRPFEADYGGWEISGVPWMTPFLFDRVSGYEKTPGFADRGKLCDLPDHSERAAH